MKWYNVVRFRLIGIALTVMMMLITFTATASAQTAQPAPTRAPSGSNPTQLAPTDVPIEWSLFWVLMFFVVLGLGLLFANWLVRRGTFNEPERRI